MSSIPIPFKSFTHCKDRNTLLFPTYLTNDHILETNETMVNQHRRKHMKGAFKQKIRPEISPAHFRYPGFELMRKIVSCCLNKKIDGRFNKDRLCRQTERQTDRQT